MFLRFDALAACFEAVSAPLIPNTPKLVNVVINTITSSSSTSVNPRPARSHFSFPVSDTDGTWADLLAFAMRKCSLKTKFYNLLLHIDCVLSFFESHSLHTLQITLSNYEKKFSCSLDGHLTHLQLRKRCHLYLRPRRFHRYRIRRWSIRTPQPRPCRSGGAH